MDKNEIAVREGSSPAEMIRLAVEGKADLDKLEKLLTLQERWESNEAKKAYHKAMADFKVNPPKIDKDKKVGYASKSGGNVGYTHASLANVTDKISVELSKYGLSASWTTKQNGNVEVTCKITHVKGHSEQTTLSAPADTSGSKNSIQAIGSTITYLERYTILALTGLATRDMDDDGAQATEFVSEAQVNEMLDYITLLKIDVNKFLEYMKADSLESIPKASFNKAMAALRSKEKKDKDAGN